MSPLPVLYSFRRCPYAMRARMALIGSGIHVEHREVLLKNKPPRMLAASPKGTVPVLVLTDGRVIDESFEIMKWALSVNDPDNWSGDDNRFLDIATALVERCESEFKPDLDCYKYADRHPGPAGVYRDRAMSYVNRLQDLLSKNRFLLDSAPCIADIALMPFVRQFAAVDRNWFDARAGKETVRWLDGMVESELFGAAMVKVPLWEF